MKDEISKPINKLPDINLGVGFVQGLEGLNYYPEIPENFNETGIEGILSRLFEKLPQFENSTFSHFLEELQDRLNTATENDCNATIKYINNFIVYHFLDSNGYLKEEIKSALETYFAIFVSSKEHDNTDQVLVNLLSKLKNLLSNLNHPETIKRVLVSFVNQYIFKDSNLSEVEHLREEIKTNVVEDISDRIDNFQKLSSALPITISIEQLIQAPELKANSEIQKHNAPLINQIKRISDLNQDGHLEENTLYLSYNETENSKSISYKVKALDNTIIEKQIKLDTKSIYKEIINNLNNPSFDYSSLSTNPGSNIILRLIIATGHISETLASSTNKDENRQPFKIDSTKLSKEDKFKSTIDRLRAAFGEDKAQSIITHYNQTLKSALSAIINKNLPAELDIQLEQTEADTYIKESEDGEILLVSRVNITLRSTDTKNDTFKDKVTIPGSLESVHVLTEHGFKLKSVNASNPFILGLVTKSEDVSNIEKELSIDSFVAQAKFAHAEMNLRNSISSLQSRNTDQPPYYQTTSEVAKKAQNLLDNILWIKSTYKKLYYNHNRHAINALTHTMQASVDVIHNPDYDTQIKYKKCINDIINSKLTLNPISKNKILAGSMLILLGTIVMAGCIAASVLTGFVPLGILGGIAGAAIIEKGYNEIQSGNSLKLSVKMNELYNTIASNKTVSDGNDSFKQSTENDDNFIKQQINNISEKTDELRNQNTIPNADPDKTRLPLRSIQNF